MAPRDRATSRRLQHLGATGPLDTQIIDLRRPALTAHDSADSRPIDWSHRWIVGGHWRSKYVPSTRTHRPTWIAPHIKGPDDRPLIVRDRVYRWVR